MLTKTIHCSSTIKREFKVSEDLPADVNVYAKVIKTLMSTTRVGQQDIHLI